MLANSRVTYYEVYNNETMIAIIRETDDFGSNTIIECHNNEWEDNLGTTTYSLDGNKHNIISYNGKFSSATNLQSLCSSHTLLTLLLSHHTNIFPETSTEQESKFQVIIVFTACIILVILLFTTLVPMVITILIRKKLKKVKRIKGKYKC